MGRIRRIVYVRDTEKDEELKLRFRILKEELKNSIKIAEEVEKNINEIKNKHFKRR
tara:strand:+ start:3155 stop:3322 length:168 start_codon:yes stop_codon:yes gene_type:complete